MIRIHIDFILARQRHLDAGVNEEGTEDVENPVETVDHTHADENKSCAHDDRANDSPEEHAVLEFGSNFEVGENENEDEDVVHTQGELDDVGGEKLLSRLCSAPEPDHSVEREREGDPDGAPAQRFLEFHFMVGIALKDPEIDREHRGDEREKTDPSPPGERRKGIDNGEQLGHCCEDAGIGALGASGECGGKPLICADER